MRQHADLVGPGFEPAASLQRAFPIRTERTNPTFFRSLVAFVAREIEIAQSSRMGLPGAPMSRGKRTIHTVRSLDQFIPGSRSRFEPIVGPA
jgi:hypothetical protein